MKANGKEAGKYRTSSAAKRSTDACRGSALHAVLKSLMNVRKAPSLDSEILRTLPAGEVVDVIAVITENGSSWLRVRLDDEDAYILYSSGRYADLRE